MSYLEFDEWAPQGYVSVEDEAAMHYASVSRNIAIPRMVFSYNGPYGLHPDKGDETFGGDTFAYIPTEVEMGAAIAMRNMSTAGELPVTGNDPGMNQLLQSIYQRTKEFWQDLRNASGTGW